MVVVSAYVRRVIETMPTIDSNNLIHENHATVPIPATVLQGRYRTKAEEHYLPVGAQDLHHAA